MKPVIIDTAAEVELAQAVQFYEHRQAGLGLDLGRAARRAVDAIQKNPEHCALRKDGTRRCVLPRFPFILHYTELPEALWVLAFAHTSRKPGYWRARLHGTSPGPVD